LAISIRPALLRDVPKLAEYLLASTGGGIEWLYKGVLPDRPTNIIVEHLFTRFGSAWAFTNCWMAQDGGQVIGGMHAALGSAFSASPADLMVPEDRGVLAAPFARLRTPEAMHIMMICVDQEYRSQGVGKTMMLEAESLATRAGTNLTSLNVRGDNPRAIELYSRLGYVEKISANVAIPTVYTGRVVHMTKQI
jgi:ribosomal protein S18 acetylase RimI-like enzyme